MSSFKPTYFNLSDRTAFSQKTKTQGKAINVRLEKAILFPKKGETWNFPGGTVVKNLSANIGDTGLIAAPGRSHIPWSN